MVHLLVSYLLFKYFIRLMRLTFAAVIGQQTVTKKEMSHQVCFCRKEI